MSRIIVEVELLDANGSSGVVMHLDYMTALEEIKEATK